MKGDFSRITNILTFDKNYSLLLMQQGRVQLDSDLNAQALIQWFRTQDLIRDLFGEHGGRGDSFKIQPDSNYNFKIDKGRYYLEGMMCENEQRHTSYQNQDNFSPPASLESGKTYLVYLHAWLRHITSVEDSYLREVALGGPDTATRLMNVWQVKAKELTVNAIDPRNDYGEFLDLIEVERDPEKGRLTAQAKKPDDEDDLCIVAPESRYRGTENQLYRVEIHRSGPAYTSEPDNSTECATFKWSRENGSVVFPVREIIDDTVILEHLGRDNRLGLNEGDWVEVVDDDYERADATNNFPVDDLLQVIEIDRDTMEVKLSGDPQRGGDESKHPLLRRWDHDGNAERSSGGALNVVEDEWIELEDGVQVMFTSNPQESPDAVTYVTRDWWWIPARTETGDIEWPLDNDGDPHALEPLDHGNRFAPLAIIEFNTDGTMASNDDLRRRFIQLWA